MEDDRTPFEKVAGRARDRCLDDIPEQRGTDFVENAKPSGPWRGPEPSREVRERGVDPVRNPDGGHGGRRTGGHY